jgi:glycosyltransferase involved in cell wall biosynthesis
VTNAKEAQPPFRMHMRPMDWACCDIDYGRGSVSVHWTDPVDASQNYIPMASPFVSKLAAIAMRLHAERAFDVMFTFYLEPYGVAGHLAAQMTGTPHVVRTAGSDAGRLWRHPQLEPLYDQVLRSAAAMITGPAVAERAIAHGVDPTRIAFAGGVLVPEHIFTADGPLLDLAALRHEVAADPALRDLLWGEFAADRPYFGIYGKLGETKGSFALLEALHRLDRAGIEVGLVALAHGTPAVQARFRARAQELGLARRILQIPFVPHWRVPEFLRSCLAVCCLEQDFPITFHTPIVLREVLLCGTCLVAATEVIRKLPDYERLPDGYGCVAIEDVNDIDELSGSLAAVASDPAPARTVGARGRQFVLDLQNEMSDSAELEQVLVAAAARRPIRSTAIQTVSATDAWSRFRFAELAKEAIEPSGKRRVGPDADASSRPIADVREASAVLRKLEQEVAGGNDRVRALMPAVQVEIAVAEAENELDQAPSVPGVDRLFRLQTRRWAMGDGDLASLFPMRDSSLRMLEFEFDVTEFVSVRTAADVPAAPASRRSFIAAFGNADGARRAPLVLDEPTAQVLALSDGTRTSSDIAQQLARDCASGVLERIETLFVQGLIMLSDHRSDEPGSRAADPHREGAPSPARKRSGLEARQA